MKKGGNKMEKGFVNKVFIYFLAISFLLLMNGFPIIGTEAKEGVPIGSMVSRGEVKFEARENVWKGVESSQFPVFKGIKIKTGNGVALITLNNDSQIEAGQNSLFSFDQNDRIHLIQGGIDFRIPSNIEMNFKVGNLFIIKSRNLQAAKGSAMISSKNQEAIGAVSIHGNGSITIKSIQGPLSILNQDRVVLAALSSKESVTISSVTVGGSPRVMVAQVGETAAGAAGAAAEAAGAGGFLGLSTGALVGIGLAGVAVVGGVAAGIGGSGGGEDGVPICP